MICSDSWVLLGILKMIPRICKFAKGQTDSLINRPRLSFSVCLQVGCTSELCWWSKGIDLLAPGLHFWLKHLDNFIFSGWWDDVRCIRATPRQSPPPPGGNCEWTWAARLEFSFVHPVCQSMHALTQAPPFIVYRVLEPLLTRHRYSQLFSTWAQN